MADRNAADMELDERDGLLNNDHRGRKLPSILRERGNSFRGLALHALHTFVVYSSFLSHSWSHWIVPLWERIRWVVCDSWNWLLSLSTKFCRWRRRRWVPTC
jgi:hypothetical protein